jgi:BirA family biotin operon repressor/biotin-[acetyl-CoA-carboxylase] ligase
MAERLLVDGAKLSGILLERVDDAVVLGFGVNLAHHPNDLERPATSLAAHGAPVDPQLFAETLAESFARWVSRWREGLAPVRDRWLARAHPSAPRSPPAWPTGPRSTGCSTARP